MELKDKLEHVHQDMLDPTTARAEHLDWLGQLCGYVGPYSLAPFTPAQKRILIAESFRFVWPYRGTRALLLFLIRLVGIEASIYYESDFILGLSRAGDPFGTPNLTYWIRVTLKYPRGSKEYKLMQRLNTLYGPVYCRSQVCYDRFYLGFSACGEPLFSPNVAQPMPVFDLSWLLLIL